MTKHFVMGKMGKYSVMSYFFVCSRFLYRSGKTGEYIFCLFSQDKKIREQIDLDEI